MSDFSLTERKISSTTVFEGNLLKVSVDTVFLPNGRKAGREIVRHPGAVAVLPVLDSGSMVFVKQYRYPMSMAMFEIPAGKLNAGEEPKDCAFRELSEETGYEASKLVKLGIIATTPGFTDEVIHLFAASGLTLHEPHSDEDEFIEVCVFSPEEVRQKLSNGEIFDAKTISALCFYFLLQGERM